MTIRAPKSDSFEGRPATSRPPENSCQGLSRKAFVIAALIGAGIGATLAGCKGKALEEEGREGRVIERVESTELEPALVPAPEPAPAYDPGTSISGEEARRMLSGSETKASPAPIPAIIEADPKVLAETEKWKIVSSTPGDHPYYSYVDENGKKIFNTSFPYAEPFKEGFAVVGSSTENRRYYINQNGVNAFGGIEFRGASQFKDGIATVSDLYGESYYIRRNGVNAFGDEKFDAVWGFIDGLAVVRREEYGKMKYFYINKNGVNAFGGDKFERAWEFSEGLSVVQKEGKWYYINKRGEKAFGDKQFEEAHPFKDGFAEVVEGVRPYVIDKNGNQVDKSK